MTPGQTIDYAVAVANERARYDNCLDVHNLPEIFHYWSQKHLLPKFQQFGFESVTAMFLQCLRKHCEAQEDAHFASLGAGNCDLEVELCRGLFDLGHNQFLMHCFDLNPVMLERGRAAAAAAGVADRMQFVEGDLNAWRSKTTYQAVLANQSLHHITNLEELFDEVKRSLSADGSFAISDMIGRNGHERWPEALRIVNEFWCELPPSYRFNRQLGRYEQAFEDWSCSIDDFEGVRAQDILPLLVERFHFKLFVPYGNVIDPFIDRSFGPNFNGHSEWDRCFIDRVQARDEAALASGELKPTHLVAILGLDSDGATRSPANLSPQACIRVPDAQQTSLPLEARPYDWSNSPHDPVAELHKICARLPELQGDTSEHAKTSVRNLQKELQSRTRWASKLQSDLERVGEIAVQRQLELDKSNQWAQGLDIQIELLEAEIKRLQSEIAESEQRRESLQTELAALLRSPSLYLSKQLGRLRSMVRKSKQSGNPNCNACSR